MPPCCAGSTSCRNQGIFTTDTVSHPELEPLARAAHRAGADAVVGQPLLRGCPELAARGFERYYRAALAGEISVLAHRFHSVPDRDPGHADVRAAPMPQSSRVAPLIDDGQIVGTITVIDDVTERVSSEAEMRRQIAAAETARGDGGGRAAAEGRVPGDAVARDPHAAQRGDRLDADPPRPAVDPRAETHALRVIDRNATAQSRLIEDMLDMARIVSGKLRLELGAGRSRGATGAAIDVVAPGRGGQERDDPTGSATRPRLIIGDADRVQQIAWNLLSNAVKFTPGGGTITVRIDQEDRAIRLIVKDTGQGISPDFLPYVFERFRQANSSASRTEGGLGLGLALVRQLVELHGGRITADSPGAKRDRPSPSRCRPSKPTSMTRRHPSPPSIHARWSVAGCWWSMTTATGGMCWCRCFASTAPTSGPQGRPTRHSRCSTRPQIHAPT